MRPTWLSAICVIQMVNYAPVINLKFLGAFQREIYLLELPRPTLLLSKHRIHNSISKPKWSLSLGMNDIIFVPMCKQIWSALRAHTFKITWAKSFHRISWNVQMRSLDLHLRRRWETASVLLCSSNRWINTCEDGQEPHQFYCLVLISGMLLRPGNGADGESRKSFILEDSY